jgi:hypothetical protein
MIDGVGSVSTSAPGVDIKTSVGVPGIKGSIRNLAVQNATAHGISLYVGRRQLADVTANCTAGPGSATGTWLAPHSHFGRHAKWIRGLSQHPELGLVRDNHGGHSCAGR